MRNFSTWVLVEEKEKRELKLESNTKSDKHIITNNIK